MESELRQKIYKIIEPLFYSDRFIMDTEVPVQLDYVDRILAVFDEHFVATLTEQIKDKQQLADLQAKYEKLQSYVREGRDGK